MCWLNKCCVFLPLDLGTLLIGFLTFVMSLIMGIYSISVLAMEKRHSGHGTDHMKLLTHLELDSSSLKIILSMFILVLSLWMVFSVLLVIGIKKNKASFLLSYFAYGIVMTILMMLSALLVLLNQHWIMTLFMFLSAMIYIHCLIVVHSTYELMQRGKRFGLNAHHEMDEDELIDPETL